MIRIRANRHQFFQSTAQSQFVVGLWLENPGTARLIGTVRPERRSNHVRRKEGSKRTREIPLGGRWCLGIHRWVDSRRCERGHDTGRHSTRDFPCCPDNLGARDRSAWHCLAHEEGTRWLNRCRTIGSRRGLTRRLILDVRQEKGDARWDS